MMLKEQWLNFQEETGHMLTNGGHFDINCKWLDYLNRQMLCLFTGFLADFIYSLISGQR